MLSTVCRHLCKDCYALNVCAVHALVDQDETIFVQTENCINCGSCKTACVSFGQSVLKNRSMNGSKTKSVEEAA